MFSVNDKGQVTFNGKPVEEMTEEERKNAYGSAGDIGAGLAQSFDFTTGAQPNFRFDPRYYEEYDILSGDAGRIGSGYRLKPEYERMQGMTQVGVPRSIGGMGEPIDPSLITYDEEFGYITPLTNIKEPRASGLAGFLESYLPYMLAAGMGAAIAATGGFAGLGIAGAGEAGGVAAGAGEGAVAGGSAVGGTAGGGGVIGTVTGLEPIVLPALEGAPVLTSIEGLGAAAGGGAATGVGSAFPAGAGIGTGGPLLETAALSTPVSAGTQALANASSLLSNLSPTSQRIIASAIGQGINAISAGRRQEEAQRFAREQSDIDYQRRQESEARAAEERRIRGTPQAFTFTTTPRAKAGIIGSGMGA